MKKLQNNPNPPCGFGKCVNQPLGWRQTGIVMTIIGLLGAFLPSAQAELPKHNVAAASLNVVQNDAGNTSASVTVTATTSVNDFRVRSGSNRGDYNIQIGASFADDVLGGIVMTSIAQNGRDNGEGTGINFVIPTIDFSTNTAGAPNAYYIPVFNLSPASTAGSEYNINVAGAYFPYTNWIGALIRIANGVNGSATVKNNEIIGTTGIAFGQNFNWVATGKSTLSLASFGIDSRTDGVLLVTGGKNEGNYALSQVNTTNGTWNLFVHDKDDNGATTEEDPIAFVFIPKTDTTVVSGRFNGDASIVMHSGTTPQFTVTSNSAGVYELKVSNGSPSKGVLIISAEGGTSINQDNIVSYQPNSAGNGWIIQSRDGPLNTATPPIAGLQSPPPTDAVVSFVYIPGATPGITVTPTNNLVTTENGDTASFTVRLDTQPSDNVTIDLSSDDTTEGVISTSQLVFTPSNWNVLQTVTVTGQDDDLGDGSTAYTIVLNAAVSNDSNYNNVDPDDVSVVNADNDEKITVSPTTGLTTTEAGGTATFNVHLNTQPTGDVTFAVSSSDGTEGNVSPSSLTFTAENWNVDQTVTVTGADDFVDDGNIAYSVVTGTTTSSDSNYNNINPANVSVLNTDNDTAGFSVSVGLNVLPVVEGETAAYTVVLQSEPTANVTVNVASSNTSSGGTVSPATLTFTSSNWNTPQAVTVTGANDLVVDPTTSFQITNSISSADSIYAALTPLFVAVATLDNEPVVTLPSGGLIYGVNQPAIGIDGRAGISDTNTPSYNGATLVVTFTANGASTDRLEIRNTGTSAGQIGVSGNNVSYGGVVVASFTGGSGTTPLSVTFNNSSTPAAAQALLRSITYRNISNTPGSAVRSLSVVVSKTDGGTGSAFGTIKISLLQAISFQEGADYGYGIYAGGNDIELRQNAPLTAFPAGSGSRIFIDYAKVGENNAYNGLLRFDNIFGDGPGQIPTNAVIVAADLYLDISDTGHASPLYRMLIPWDATNETWDSIGNGVDQDDIESRSSYDSALGLPNPSFPDTNAPATTGVGIISISVLPDVKAWANGENNYGWVVPGWSGDLTVNGTGFSSGESPDVSVRPRLRVLWLPAGTASASFRQGVNDYAGAKDTRVRATTPDASSAAVTGIFVDWAVNSTSDNEHVLIRFDDIFGNGAGQIPPGATIHAAMLDLGSTLVNSPGDGGTFHAMLQPWNDTDTWNMLNNGISANDVEAASAPTAVAGNAALLPNVQAGFLEFELTPDVQAWSSGTRTNYGWAILPWPNGGDGWGFATSEAATERERPQLRVYYTPGVPSAEVSLTITKSGNDIQISWLATAAGTLETTSTLTTPNWLPVSQTPATVGSQKVVTISSPSGIQFYRLHQ